MATSPIDSPEGAGQLLRVEQVAERLNVPVRWVWRAIAQGTLTKRKVGKYVRIHPDDLTAYIEQQRVPPRSESTRTPKSNRPRSR